MESEISDEQKLILEHEKVHIRQWHSLDVLLMEICVIIKWFNPLIYWFRDALKATHEFIADQYVIQQKSNVRDYATLLVNQHKLQTAAPLTNTFYSMTKKRLNMMLQQPSHWIHSAKYLLILPIIMVLMLLFSFNLLEEIPQVSKGLDEMNTVLGKIGERTVYEAEGDDSTLDMDEYIDQIIDRNKGMQIQFGHLQFPFGGEIGNPMFGNSHKIDMHNLKYVLQKEIQFTDNGQKVDISKIDIVIPYPSYIYDEREDLETGKSYFSVMEEDGPPFKMETTNLSNLQFAEHDIETFLAQIHKSSSFYINAYKENQTYTAEFRVSDTNKNDLKNQINSKKDYQLFWGNQEIPITHHNKLGVNTSNFEMEMKEFIKVLRSPIQFKKFGKTFKPKKIAIHIYGEDATAMWSVHPKNFGQFDYLKEIVIGIRKEDIFNGQSYCNVNEKVRNR